MCVLSSLLFTCDTKEVRDVMEPPCQRSLQPFTYFSELSFSKNIYGYTKEVGLEQENNLKVA